MVKFEGESGIDLQFVLDQLQKGTTLSVQKIKKAFVQACCRESVFNELKEAINCMIRQGKV